MERVTYRLFFIAVASLFAGRALQAWFGNPALVEIMGFEGFMKPFVSRFMTWDQFGFEVYPVVAEALSSCLFLVWTLFFLGLWFPRFQTVALRMGAILAILEVAASLTGEYYWWLHQAARSLMGFTPFLFLLFLKRHRYHLFLGKVLVALVFIAHGMLALNLLPLPGAYEDMFSLIFGFDEDLAESTLRWIGILDIVMALILVSFSRVPSATWIWLSAWGLITALARVVAAFEPSIPLESLGVGLGESLIRLCHGLVPWALSTIVRSVR